MPDVITTIKDPEDIHYILEKKDVQPDNVIILTKGDIIGLANIEKENYSIKFMEGDFFDILSDIKCAFETAVDPCFIAGENELDIYVTYYLVQVQKTVPFYVIDEGKLISIPVSVSHAFTPTKKKIMEYLTEVEDSNSEGVINHLSKRGKFGNYSKLTINQYLHELENSDLIESRGDRYSINEKGARFIEIMK